MKNIRQLVAAAALTLAICSVAFAGDMWTPGIGNPPPPGGGGRVATSTTPKVELTALDTLTETAMFFYKNTLSLF